MLKMVLLKTLCPNHTFTLVLKVYNICLQSRHFCDYSPPDGEFFLLRSVCSDLGPGETLMTWPILNGFPNFKDQQIHDAPEFLLVLSLKKLTIPRQS